MTGQDQGGLQVISKLVFLDKGLHLFRIIETPQDCTAFLGLSSTPVGVGKIDFFPAENVTDHTLRRTGDCIVVRVSGDRAGLLITEYQVGVGGGDIKLRIDRVATDFSGANGTATSSAPALTAQASPLASDDAKLEVKVLGHISGRGDIIASNGWIGQPGVGALEGFAVKVLGLPPNVTLTYSCRLSGERQARSGVNGEFIGSRSKNNKIKGIKFSLSGPQSDHYLLSGETHFSQAGAIDIMNGIMLEGSESEDFVTAFRLIVTKRSPGAVSLAADLKKTDKTVKTSMTKGSNLKLSVSPPRNKVPAPEIPTGRPSTKKGAAKRGR